MSYTLNAPVLRSTVAGCGPFHTVAVPGRGTASTAYPVVDAASVPDVVCTTVRSVTTPFSTVTSWIAPRALAPYMGWYRMAFVEWIGRGLALGLATGVTDALGLGLRTAALFGPQLVNTIRATTPQILGIATTG
jgi:hypothetical protein